MNHGNYYDDDDEDDMDINNLPGANIGGPSNFGFGRTGPGGAGAMGGGILSQLFGSHMDPRRFGMPQPEAFAEYYKAYSVAVMPGPERANLAYGGKIIMPPSALANLSALDLPSPWTFQLRNPKNPKALSTHAGVLEFIADEGLVYLPYWMMKTLQLQEGDPIRVLGAILPKGKMVKIQAQNLDFLEVSDPKAVLESALRQFAVLSKGDMIEITYNSMTFEFLIMETTPEGPGISVIDTDLEVDFATPKGYVEPPPKAPVPIPTMADKLKIDINSTTSATSTRPPSAASLRPPSSINDSGGEFETFKGLGATLNGRRTKGKGKAKKVDEVDKDSKIIRTDKPRIVTNESIANDGRLVPAALELPLNQLFLGYKYVPFDPKKVVKKKDVENGDATQKPSFGGGGTTLSGRPPVEAPQMNDVATAATAQAPEPDHWAALGGGSKLSTGRNDRIGGSVAAPIEVMDEDEDDSGSEFNGFDEDDDAIVIDSD